MHRWNSNTETVTHEVTFPKWFVDRLEADYPDTARATDAIRLAACEGVCCESDNPKNECDSGD